MRCPAIRCDIFCSVIDNLGDAGVSWRLARQLAKEHDWQVRLWIDDPSPIHLLAPENSHPNLEISRWTGDFTGAEPADVVIEAFACQLPRPYIEAMARQTRSPVWLNLEYLSAEDWVTGCHGLPSPHPPLVKHFFFPGFVAGTGGLLRDQTIAAPPVQTFTNPLEVSLFCYRNPALPALLDFWCDGMQQIICHVAAGLPHDQVVDWLGESFPDNAVIRRGMLTLHALPFLPQTAYDKLLDECQLNFVRGEDSFVRAQWAERPFVWQAYPQEDHAHIAKLDAFLCHYLEDVDEARAAHNFMHAWNGKGILDWPAFTKALPSLVTHASSWARQIAIHGDLATNLVKFCAVRL